ncbi:MAG: GNAT family N-acetyltransferase [Pseudomonadota bacterium]|nr:GNAT family N-acetyltransferase [Pseudomonadota bacterium]
MDRVSRAGRQRIAISSPKTADIEPIWQLHCQTDDNPWSKADFMRCASKNSAQEATEHRSIASPHLHLFQAKNEEAKLLGFALFSLSHGLLELYKIAVWPAARSQGIGHALLAHGLNTLTHDSCLLEVSQQNISAILLYERLGFTTIDRRKNYYSHLTGEAQHALIMQRPRKALDD